MGSRTRLHDLQGIVMHWPGISSELAI